MPYKNKEQNKIYQREWARKNRVGKAKYKIANTVRKMAQKSNPTPQVCAIISCNKMGIDRHHPDYSKPHEIMWLCRKHHMLKHKQPTKICCLINCEKKYVCKGLCMKHYDQSRSISGRFKINTIEKLSLVIDKVNHIKEGYKSIASTNGITEWIIRHEEELRDLISQLNDIVEKNETH